MNIITCKVFVFLVELEFVLIFVIEVSDVKVCLAIEPDGMDERGDNWPGVELEQGSQTLVITKILEIKQPIKSRMANFLNFLILTNLKKLQYICIRNDKIITCQ